MTDRKEFSIEHDLEGLSEEERKSLFGRRVRGNVHVEFWLRAIRRLFSTLKPARCVLTLKQLEEAFMYKGRKPLCLRKVLASAIAADLYVCSPPSSPSSPSSSPSPTSSSSTNRNINLLSKSLGSIVSSISSTAFQVANSLLWLTGDVDDEEEEEEEEELVGSATKTTAAAAKMLNSGISKDGADLVNDEDDYDADCGDGDSNESVDDFYVFYFHPRFIEECVHINDTLHTIYVFSEQLPADLAVLSDGSALERATRGRLLRVNEHGFRLHLHSSLQQLQQQQLLQHSITQVDKARITLHSTIRRLQRASSQLTPSVTKARVDARRLLAANRRADALRVLKRANPAKREIERLEELVEKLQTMLITIDQAQTNVEVHKAMSVGAAAHRNILGNLDESSIEATMDELAELMDKQQLIDEAIADGFSVSLSGVGGAGGADDDDTLLAEFEASMLSESQQSQASDDDKLHRSIESSMPEVPTTSPASASHAPDVKREEERSKDASLFA